MEAAEVIRLCVARVDRLRKLSAGDSALDLSLRWVKTFQSRRFVGTYVDLLTSPRFSAAAQFFLVELYGDRDYALRDAQFARIANVLQRVFPTKVVDTAVALARLHALTEELDFEMARADLKLGREVALDGTQRYLKCWRIVGRSDERSSQLDSVLTVGGELDHLTRTRGLRTMLRLMRGPARAAGLDALQTFLESGFDTFSSLAVNGNYAKEFLNTIQVRESAWIDQLNNERFESCVGALHKCLIKSTPPLPSPTQTGKKNAPLK